MGSKCSSLSSELLRLAQPLPLCAAMNLYRNRFRASCAVGLGIILLLSFTSAAQAASLRLAWDPATSVAGYRLYWGTQSGIYTNTIDIGNQTSGVANGLITGVTYFFTIPAYNNSRLL